MADGVNNAPLEAAPALALGGEPVPQVALRARPESRLFPYLEGGAVGAEQFRLLHAQLMHSSSPRRVRRLMVTSALAGEGKTHVAANLALMMAGESGRKVLLVDADLRKPEVHKLYGIENRAGLSNLLLEGAPARAVLRRVQDSNLYVVPGGTPLTKPLAGFHAAALKAFLDEVSAAFDFVLLDSPPLLLVADATLLATLADGLLFVVRARATPRELVLKAKGLLDPEKTLGTVLVGLDPMAPYGARYQDLYQSYLRGAEPGSSPSRSPRRSLQARLKALIW